MSKQKLWVTPYQYMEIPTGSLTSEIATRQRSGDLIGLLDWLPNPDIVLRKLGRQIDAYEDLTADADLYGVLRQRRAGVLKLQWDIDGKDADKRVTQFVEDFMEPMRGSGMVRDATSEMLGGMDFGYKPLEVIWERVGDYDLPMSISGKPSRWFKYDAKNNLLFISTSNYMGEPVPDMKFAVSRQNATYENPYGDADLSRCFWPVTFKKGGLRFWLTFVEKYGMPWVLGKYPQGTKVADIDELASRLDDMVQDAVGVFEEHMNVEVHQTGVTASADIFERFLVRCERQLSKVILGHSSVSDATPGKLGNETMATTVREDIIEDATAMCQQTWNTIISWAVKHNFGDVPAPLFRMYEEEDVDMELVNRDAILTKDLGVKFTDEYISETYKIDKKYFELKKPSEPAPAPPAIPGVPIVPVNPADSTTPPPVPEAPPVPPVPTQP